MMGQADEGKTRNRSAWPFYSGEIGLRIAECLDQGDLGSVDGHPAITAFEQEFETLLGGQSKAAFFNSGTSAFGAGLFALNLPPESEVVVPRQTFRASVTPLLHFRLIPRFAECSSTTGTISSASVCEALSSRTSAIVVTHQWGQPAEIAELKRIAQHHRIRLIEDCSHAHGGSFDGKPLGTFGDISFFSCGTTKPITGGTGGIFLTADTALFQRALLYGQPKRRCELAIDDNLRPAAGIGLGVNLRGNPFSAVLAHDHIRSLKSRLAVRTTNWAEFDEMIRRYLPQLQPVQPPAAWTQGTWYKRPFIYSGNNIQQFLSEAAAENFEFGRQDPPLDSMLFHAAKLLNRPVEGDALPPPSRSILTLSGHSLYAPNWNRDAADSKLQRLAMRLCV